MPIAHGHHHARHERFAEFRLQRPRLPRRHLADGRLAADFLIVLADFARAPRGNQPRQGLARQPRKREVDDVGVAKQVIEKRFDGVERVGPAQLKQYHPDARVETRVRAGQSGNLSEISGAWNSALSSGPRNMSTLRPQKHRTQLGAKSARKSVVVQFDPAQRSYQMWTSRALVHGEFTARANSFRVCRRSARTSDCPCGFGDKH